MKPMLALVVVLLTLSPLASAQTAQSVDPKYMIESAELVRLLQTSKPLILMVGPHAMYAQAHIPGAQYVGMTYQPEGLQALRDRIHNVPKTKAIVLYCGCCPWERCPNIAPALAELQAEGFKNVKVLHIAQNFGADWVNKGLPLERGQAASSQGQ